MNCEGVLEKTPEHSSFLELYDGALHDPGTLYDAIKSKKIRQALNLVQSARTFQLWFLEERPYE